jgi:adenosine deaminase
MMKNIFIKALENNDLEAMKSVKKSDLHNHATRGGNIRFIEEWSKTSIDDPPKKFNDLFNMQCWYDNNIKPLCKGQVGFIKRVEAAFLQATQDGVTVLCMSFGTGDKIHFNNDLQYYVSAIDKIHKSTAPDIHFIPEVCFGRTDNIEPIEKEFDEVISLNFFKSIDLVGDDTKPVDNYRNIYRKAKKKGYILKAHVGEFGDAESIRRAVEVLELQQVQHGISAIKSKDVMKWLANNKIQLNICPTSNVMLNRVEDYNNHPIKELYYNGIPVTINTDDMLIFNQSLSEDYLNLFSAGLFSANELNEIRETGLRC